MKFLRRLIPYAFVILAFVLVFLLAGDCSGPDKSNRLHELLKLIPADADLTDSLIIINDYASCFEDYGISLVELDKQSITFQGFIDLIREKEIEVAGIGIVIGSYITGWGKYASHGTIQDKYVGYSFTSIDAEIQAGTPPQGMVAAIGRFDPEATSDALAHQDEWPLWAVDAYTTEKYRSVTIHSWGDGFKINMDTTLTPPHIDLLGRARPLAVTRDYLFYTFSLENIKSMIDASQGNRENLADLPEFAEIVDKLSGLKVYSALLGNESLANGDPGFPENYPGPLLKNFETFGSAFGKDDNGTFMVLVLYHENPDDAEVNISLLEQRLNSTDMMALEIPWTELITAKDIHAEGNLLVAKLYTERMSIFQIWVYNYDPILLHEQ